LYCLSVMSSIPNRDLFVSNLIFFFYTALNKFMCDQLHSSAIFRELNVEVIPLFPTKLEIIPSEILLLYMFISVFNAALSAVTP
jgi:hypothetical protein